jgi:hypothetical protein
MDTLRCFLTDREDTRALFEGLSVENSSVWPMLNAAPVFHFTFKGFTADNYKAKIYNMVKDDLTPYYHQLPASAFKDTLNAYLQTRECDTDAFYFLTRAVYTVTGKKSYILIDEYDKLLMDQIGSEQYEEIRGFLTHLLSAVLKDNAFLEKGLLTGVMRISHEGMFSGLNNIDVFDVFSDPIYKRDFGITEEEMAELQRLRPFDTDEVEKWYNGFRIDGEKLYNIFSVSRYLQKGKFDTYWGKSGTMELVARAMNGDRLRTVTQIAAGEQEAVEYTSLSSLNQIQLEDGAFYSLLIQAGYLSVISSTFDEATVCIPNQEMCIIWKKFIFAAVMLNNSGRARGLFRIGDPQTFAAVLEQLMTDTLSFWDFRRQPEQAYHLFLFGGLVFADSSLDPSKIKSNRESGDGRYDIWMEKDGINYIFELKRCTSAGQLKNNADAALRQIDDKRYGAELDRSKPLWKVGISCCKKQCRVKCAVQS